MENAANGGERGILCRDEVWPASGRDLDGERVVSADPVIGYMHRGYEKLTEFRTYPQITTLINRIDWLSSFANEVPFIDAAEKLMGVEAPPRAQAIRAGADFSSGGFDHFGRLEALRERLAAHFRSRPGVIVTDSWGRAWRRGTVGVALLTS